LSLRHAVSNSVKSAHGNGMAEKEENQKTDDRQQ
jgi:hypothetical protein